MSHAHPAVSVSEFPAQACMLSPHEHIGFELGRDYAHHAQTPPAPYDQEPSPLHNGRLAGRAAFGERTLPASRALRRWLQLRLHAWLRGRSVELFQVTPHYLRQLDVSHCPITRTPLSAATLQPSDATFDRVRHDAAYAAGNLAVMSARANQAKAALGWREAQQVVDTLQAGLRRGRPQDHDGLNVAQWSRIAVLCSFVEALPHQQACALPMLLLPPNRLRLFNPVQALQAFISLQLLRPGWSRRVREFETLLPGVAVRRAFQGFFLAWLPRVLENSRKAGRPAQTLQTRWAIEDAWQHAPVLRRWVAFAGSLDAVHCEALVTRATAQGLGCSRLECFSEAQATEGWQLESRGYVAHAVPMQRRPAQAAPRRKVAASLPRPPCPPSTTSFLFPIQSPIQLQHRT